ncbi:MAG: RNA 2',3'-cyclic phosphodiesterase [Phycisphaerae bacterium]
MAPTPGCDEDATRMKRLFVAIELDDAVRGVLDHARVRLARSCDGVRWVQPELMHLTLRFLGDVADGDVAEVCAAVEDVARDCKPFGIELGRAGCFPRRGPVRVLWVGVEEPTGALVGCAGAVSKAIESLGFEPDRQGFSAHITLGRARADRSDGAMRSAVERWNVVRERMDVNAMALIASVLTPQGPVYSPVCQARFGGI